MDKEFDYKESLTDIKASLFDIYEDQEKKIGDLDDSIREQHVNDFIEVKDLALILLEKIQKLYYPSINTEEDEEDSSLESEVESDDSSFEKESLEEGADSSSVQDGNLDDNILEENPISLENHSNEGDTSFISDSDEVIEEVPDENDSIEERSIEFSEGDHSNEVLKYYLTCDEAKLNFAYVPEKLFEKLKNNKKEEDDISFQENDSLEEEPSDSEDEINSQFSLEIDDSKIYKQDELPAKGIIVRNDQYMKLALSKHRQEGVLKEAKSYRIEAVRKKRQEEQKIALEKAKVHLDI